MGSGIAYACAKAGLEVVLKDISRSVAEKGKSYAEEKLKVLVDRTELTAQEMQTVLGRIKATEKVEEFDGCDLIIEAWWVALTGEGVHVVTLSSCGSPPTEKL